MRVGARQDEAGHAAGTQLRPQGGEPSRAVCAGLRVIEGLELGLEHPASNLVTARKGGNAVTRTRAIDDELCDAE
jgi:hypothetical protein